MTEKEKLRKQGEAIKALREKRKLSQVELAELAGVTCSTVAGWELGTHGIRSTRMGRVANALHCTTDQLLGH